LKLISGKLYTNLLMNSKIRLSDALRSVRSQSKLNSEIHSANQENEIHLNALEKSFNLRASSKDAFHLSIEIDSSKDLFANLVRPNSPSLHEKPSFLKRFSRRFDALRKNAQDDDFLNNSLYVNAQIKGDGFLFGTPEIMPFQELKSNPSFHNFLPDKENSIVSEKIRSSSNNKSNSPFEPSDKITFAIKSIRANSQPKKDKALDIFQIEEKIKNDIFQLQKLTDRGPASFMFSTLHRLYENFVHIFSKGCLSPEEYELTTTEEEIMNCLLQRKFFQNMTSYQLGLPLIDKIDCINDIIRGRSNKRPEECYKFILTRANKHLKKKLSPFALDTEESEKTFYRHYFEDLSKTMNLPIEQFVYPITRKQIKVAKLNSSYFERIFKSQAYLADVQSYIDNFVYKEYKEELKKKLRSFLSKFDYMLQKPNCNVLIIEQTLKEYLLKNKRCKLPWTTNEIKESVIRFQILVESLRSK
jgi:hypothetical protein